MKRTATLPLSLFILFIACMVYQGMPNAEAAALFQMGSLGGREKQSNFAGGTGTAEDPYQVENPDQLYSVRNHLDKHFIQTADIDLSGFSEGKGWKPIGTWNFHDGHEEKLLFEGTYDGDGYSISNLTIYRRDHDSIGLFGAIDDQALITNVSLKNIRVEGNRRVGGLVGKSFGGNITNSSAEGSVKGKEKVGILAGRTFGNIYNSYALGTAEGANRYVGGLVGLSAPVGNIADSYAEADVKGYSSVGGLVGRFSGDLSDSYASGTVEGTNHIGGLLGWSSNGDISGCYASGTVISSGRNSGGLIGWSAGDVSNSYAQVSVSGSERVGGLLGYVYRGTVSNAYAAGSVSGKVNAGGLIGEISEDGNVRNSYYDSETSGQEDDEGKGIPKTTQEMMRDATFLRWNFNRMWGIDQEEGYPYLRWQERL